MTQSVIDKKLFARKNIRRALKAWPSSSDLGGHPLAELRVVDARRRREAYADTPAGRGVALRHLLNDLVETLRPEEEARNQEPNFARRQWRYYYIIRKQYFEGRRAQDLREVMGISESGYFKDQRYALDSMGERLREWEMGLGDGPAVPASPAETEPAPPPTTAAGQPTAETDTNADVNADVVHVNFPHPPTPFLGREEERDEIVDLLGRLDSRLISIVGPGGMGKTRLAMQVAQEQAALPAYFVPLDTIESADLLVPTIAQVIRFTAGSQTQSAEQLLSFLRGKRLLLVLDNFEHVVTDGVPLVADILRRAPDIKLLITSRERLNVRGEWTIDLGGLAVPETDVDEPEAYSAVQLFCHSVARVRGGVYPPDNEMDTVIEICRLVNGMPLGLELAASWSSMMTCTDIAAEIKDNIDFLAGAFRDLPERHRSLRAVFNHSWALLSDAERGAFRRLAVFAGSFDRTAAQEIAAAPLPVLLMLTGKSLLRSSHGRYAIHGLLRQFVREKLRDNRKEWMETRAKHARYYAELMRDHIPVLKQGGAQAAALRRAEQELENVRLAWQWALTHEQDEMLLAAAEAIYLFFSMSNRAQEGHTTTAQIVGYLRGRRPFEELSLTQKRLLGFARGVQGRFRHIMGDLPQAQEAFRESLEILRIHGQDHERALIGMLAIETGMSESGYKPAQLYGESLAFYERINDAWGIANSHLRYVAYLRHSGATDTYGQQKALMQDSLRLRRKIGDRRGVASCLNYLCDLAYERGDYAEAKYCAEQSLAIYRELKDYIGSAHSLNHLGQVAGTNGDYTAAKEYYQESLAILREYGNPREVAVCLDCVGYIAYLQESYDEARDFYQESLRLSHELDDLPGVAWSQHNLGDIARAEGDYGRAKDLYMESYQLHSGVDPVSWGGGVALDKLGRVTLALGETAEAEQHFAEALRIATVTSRRREALDALFHLGRLRLQNGCEEEARRLWRLVVSHAATAKETRDEASALLTDLPAGEGETPILDEVADELLKNEAAEGDARKERQIKTEK